MDISKEVEKGQAIYSKWTLPLYDIVVLGISNSYIWKCPTEVILTHFNQHISSNHLDIGVGTGYFLDKCQFPTDKAHVSLLDLNRHSLDSASQRINRYNPTLYQCNILEKIEIQNIKFDSISLNYLFHCLPGDLKNKLQAIDNISHLLSDDGEIFGSTILGKNIKRNFASKHLMNFYNKKGIFHNSEDCIEDLERYLSKNFSKYNIETVGCVALFSASKRII